MFYNKLLPQLWTQLLLRPIAWAANCLCMAHGKILWFDADRGFGFIRPDMGPRDVFMHASALGEPGEQEISKVKPGTRVEFELVQTGDGRLTAHRVLPVLRHSDQR